MGKNQSIWRKGPDGTAHLVENSRARCAIGGFPKGKQVGPPEGDDGVGYCRHCHYRSLFGALPETKQKILTRLVNLELERLVLERAESFKKDLEVREKAVSDRSAEISKGWDEINKLRREQKDNEKLVEVGKAFRVLFEAIGDSIMKSSERAFGGFYRR